jgi:hypothetical protein
MSAALTAPALVDPPELPPDPPEPELLDPHAATATAATTAHAPAPMRLRRTVVVRWLTCER